MQDLLSNLSGPITIVLIIIGVVILVAVVLLARWLRRRQSSTSAEAPLISSGPVDYTSLPLEEEPTGWRERFNRLSLAGKVLLAVVPLLLIVGATVLVLALQPSGPPPPLPATPIPLALTIDTASLANPRTIRIVGQASLPPDTQVSADLLAGGQPFPWFDPETAVGPVRRERVELNLLRLPDAPATSREVSYTVVLRADVGGQPVASEPAPLEIPSIYADDFYGTSPVAVVPTKAPTEAPTVTLEPVSPTPELTPTATLPPTPNLAATVANGGNVRRQPVISPDNVVDQVNANETVQLLERSPDGRWYRIRNIRDNEGWVSGSLLTVEPSVAAQVPIPLVATVRNGGNVRRQPVVAPDNVVDQINAFETVQLIEKTADGNWYRIKNIRDNEGWVSASLLTIDPVLIGRVPLQGAAPLPEPSPDAKIAPTATAATPGSATATAVPSTGLTAPVRNGGNVRRAPVIDANNIVDQINARETVELLQKTADGGWYRIRNARGVEGWVNATLLTIAPEVAERVPVA